MNIKNLTGIKNSLLFIIITALTACSLEKYDGESDQRLLAQDQSAAEDVVRKFAPVDLPCAEKINTRIVSRNEKYGAPLGFLWSDYTILATGCSKTITYTIECRGDQSRDCFHQRK